MGPVGQIHEALRHYSWAGEDGHRQGGVQFLPQGHGHEGHRRAVQKLPARHQQFGQGHQCRQKSLESERW